MWSGGLVKTMKDPKYVIYKDNKIVIIRDVYPKAKYHFLVLPEEDLPNFKSLSSNHVELLSYMEDKGKEIAEQLAPSTIFKYGYHARPSMQRIHLHVISNDMISDALKTKKHYNSFTTEFFNKSEDVIKGLQETGHVTTLPSSTCDALLSRDLKCHICNLPQRNIPKLKEHLKTHYTP